MSPAVTVWRMEWAGKYLAAGSKHTRVNSLRNPPPSLHTERN